LCIPRIAHLGAVSSQHNYWSSPGLRWLENHDVRLRNISVRLIHVRLGHAGEVVVYNFLCFILFASCFVYTSWRFYAFSGTKLLTRCHSVSSCFLLFLCFRKATQKIFSELDETKIETPIFPGRRMRTEREPEGGQRAATP
jgi:hypothetical protein